MTIEEVDGWIQGAAYPLAEAAEEPQDGLQGPVNCGVAPDGDIYIANIRDSGWGGANNTGSIVRIKTDFAKLPAGIREVTANPSGFRIRFTKPVSASLASKVSSYGVSSVRRISTPAYGGDDVDRRREEVVSATRSSDGLSVDLELPELRVGFVYEFRLKNLLESEETFFPAEAYYTLRRIPAGR